MHAQEHQVAGGVLLGDGQLVGQLDLEQAAVGQPGEAVLVGFLAQFLAACGFFGKQLLELLDHLVHRQHHPLELGGAWHAGQGEELAAADGLGLVDHVVERAQLGA